MPLQSNIFNITKVRNGVDANSRRTITNVETIYKFPSEYTEPQVGETSGLITYTLSPDVLIIGVIDTATKQAIDISNATIEITFSQLNLKELIGVTYYDAYFNKKQTSTSENDDFHWYFHIQSFYDDLYAGELINLSEEAKEIIRSFFEAQDPTDIGFDIITNDASLYRSIPLQIGSNLDIAAFSIEPVRGIFAAMQGAGLEFTSNGLAITNGNFLITNSNNEAVLNFNKDDGTLAVTGQINATSGRFHGIVEAESGYFNNGTIGGFNITENSIESQTQKLQLFSQVSIDSGIIEQGSIDSSNHQNISANDIVRTQDYISVQSGHTYIIKTNVRKLLIMGFEENNSNSYLQATDWVNSGYSYTAPIITSEVGGVLVQNTVNFIRIILKEQDGTSITPEDVDFLTIIEDSSLINVENIHIGDGGVLDGYLRVGNLSLINPSKNYSSGDYGAVVMELTAPSQQGTDEVYFQLTSEGYIQGNNWSIGKGLEDDVVTARFGRLIAGDGEFSGTIYAKNGSFTGEILSSIISASTINTANFVTEKTRSMGGSFVFKPTFEILNIEDKGSNNVEFTLSENSNGYFSVVDEIIFSQEQLEQGGISFTDTTRGQLFNSTARVRTRDFIQVNPNEVFSTSITTEKTLSWRAFAFYDQNKNYISYITSALATVPENSSYMKIVLATDVEGETLSPSDIENFILKRVSDKIVAISGFDTRFGKITNVNDNKVQIELKNADYNILKAENALENYKTLTLFGSAYYDTLIGINSDNVNDGDILSPRALSMETFTSLQGTPSETGDIDYNLNLLLGDLSTLKEKLGSEFNYIDGYGLYADNVYLHGSLTTKNNNGTYAGVYTLKNIDFNYGKWSGNSDNNDYNNEKIIFWGGSNTLSDEGIQESPFIVTDKGSIFANRGEFKGTVITDSIISNTIIQTPVIYGSGSDPSLRIYNTDSDNGGIVFYKKVGAVDKLTEQLQSPENDDIMTLKIDNTGFVHYYNNSPTAFINFSEYNAGSSSSSNITFNGTSYAAGTTTFSSRQIKDTGEVEAIINLISGVKNSNNQIVPGNIEIKYKTFGIKISDDDNLAAVRNYGGRVINEGETIFKAVTGNQRLDYKIKNNYYCLFVS